tara:strand:+ start:2867 stop:3202 length:336 start_codon:yes stop_codon:yes gene_type:complete
MALKIVLGIFLGILAGGAFKDYKTTTYDPFNAPETSNTGKDGLAASAGVSCLCAAIFVIYTFINYPLVYGFMGMGEILIGLALSNTISYPVLRLIGFSAGPVAILLGITMM